MTTAQIRTLIEREVIRQLNAGRTNRRYEWSIGDQPEDIDSATVCVLASEVKPAPSLDFAQRAYFARLVGEDCHVMYSASAEASPEPCQYAEYQHAVAEDLGVVAE